MTEIKTAPQILLEACDILDQRGWTRNDFESPKGCVCADGALRLAAGANESFALISNNVAYVLAKKTVEANVAVRTTLVGFNDVCATNKRQIQRLFRKTAKELMKNE